MNKVTRDCGCNKKVKMSVPEGAEFNTPYTIPNETMDHTIHNEHYYEYNRNMNKTIDTDDVKFRVELDYVCRSITDLLKQKNKDYGNTALNPPNIFSKLGSQEALYARIDDKLSRIKNKGINDATEDTVNDLIGYLLLLKMSNIKQ
jgi:hypothetical protein